MVASEMGVSITRHSPEFLIQVARGTVCAAVQTHVLAHNEYLGVAQHLFAGGFPARTTGRPSGEPAPGGSRERSAASARTTTAAASGIQPYGSTIARQDRGRQAEAECQDREQRRLSRDVRVCATPPPNLGSPKSSARAVAGDESGRGCRGNRSNGSRLGPGLL